MHSCPLISGSYPRLIEIDKDTTIILNDRLFTISENGQSLKELTNSSYYMDGQRFCSENVVFIREAEEKGNSIIISGACYGVLYLPESLFWANTEVRLLASMWSQIVVDYAMTEVDSLIMAANSEASIIFRAALGSANVLNAAVTDNAFVEFKTISAVNYVSMITLEGSQIYIPSLLLFS